MLADVVVVAAGYLLGNFPTAALIGRLTGHDPTAEGSRNPGATNVYRTSGRAAGAAVLLVDVAKGALAAALGLLVGDHTLGVAAGSAAVVGHIAPVTRGFRGGKGVATGAGMAAVCYPGLSLLLAAAFAIAVVLTRRVSVGSLLLALLLPVGVAAGGYPAVEVLITTALCIVVIARHHDNIRRLRRGLEPTVRSAPRKAAT